MQVDIHVVFLAANYLQLLLTGVLMYLKKRISCCRIRVCSPEQYTADSCVVAPSVLALCASVKLGGVLLCASSLEHPPDCLVISALLAVDLDRGVCLVTFVAFKYVKWGFRFGLVGCRFGFHGVALDIATLGALEDGIDFL